MLDNILALKDKFDLFIFDVFGVLWDGSKLYEAVPERLKALMDEGKKVILLSNGTERIAEMEKSQLSRGLEKGVHYNQIFSSGELAYRCFSEDDRQMKYYVYGVKEPALFADSCYQEVADYRKADFIYIGIPKVLQNDKMVNVTDIKPFVEDLERFCDDEMVLICANPDLRAVVGGYDEPIVCQGSLARYYQEIDGEVEYFGKPYPDIFAAALEDYEDIEPARILMVGDTLETDILGASSLGIKTALTTSGMSYLNMLDEGEFSDLKEYMEDLQIVADYLLTEV